MKKAIFVTIGIVAIIGALQLYFPFTDKNAYSVGRGKILDTVYGYGQVKSDRVFTFNSRLNNQEMQIAFQDGAIVRQGSPLLLSSERVVLRAPFTGIVHLKHGSVNMIELKDISDRFINVLTPPKNQKKIKLDNEVKIFCANSQTGDKVERVISIKELSNNSLIKVSANNLPESILPESNCDVEIITGEKSNALLIPISALKKGHVWVKRANGFPRKVDVELGVINKEWGEVVSGDINVGDKVLTF